MSHTVDTTVKLWDYLYKVRIPYLDSQSVDYLKLVGVRLSGIKEFDSDIKNQWMTTMMSVATMVEYFQKDVPIKIVNPSDVTEIYNSISDHIHVWKQRLERGINIGDAPIDDLIALDAFANTVYDHAKYQFTREIADSIIGTQMSNLQRINMHNFFTSDLDKFMDNANGAGDIHINKADEEDKYPKRESLGEFFKSSLIGRRRY